MHAVLVLPCRRMAWSMDFMGCMGKCKLMHMSATLVVSLEWLWHDMM